MKIQISNILSLHLLHLIGLSEAHLLAYICIVWCLGRLMRVTLIWWLTFKLSNPLCRYEGLQEKMGDGLYNHRKMLQHCVRALVDVSIVLFLSPSVKRLDFLLPRLCWDHIFETGSSTTFGRKLSLALHFLSSEGMLGRGNIYSLDLKRNPPHWSFERSCTRPSISHI